MANNDCLYLNRLSRRCTIYHKRTTYNKRPTRYREHSKVGPKPNFYAFLKEEVTYVNNLV